MEEDKRWRVWATESKLQKEESEGRNGENVVGWRIKNFCRGGSSASKQEKPEGGDYIGI